MSCPGQNRRSENREGWCRQRSEGQAQSRERGPPSARGARAARPQNESRGPAAQGPPPLSFHTVQFGHLRTRSQGSRPQPPDPPAYLHMGAAALRRLLMWRPGPVLWGPGRSPPNHPLRSPPLGFSPGLCPNTGSHPVTSPRRGTHGTGQAGFRAEAKTGLPGPPETPPRAPPAKCGLAQRPLGRGAPHAPCLTTEAVTVVTLCVSLGTMPHRPPAPGLRAGAAYRCSRRAGICRAFRNDQFSKYCTLFH